MTAQEELARRIERDSICRAVQKKIDEGKADFSDTARYNDRAAELLGEVLAAYVPDMPPDERETLCKGLLRQRYLDTNAMLNAVQRALDTAQGLHLAPQIADYPEERVEQAAHALADETVPVETIVRRVKSAPATIARSFHDDYIEKNAAFRSSAGLKCYITRIAAGGCCKWCTAMAGRFEYGEEPDDIYRRHDNCSCTVTYENGRKRQDVWSKREWEAPDKNAGASKPAVFSQEQAVQIETQHSVTHLTPEKVKSLQGGLTKGGEGDKIKVNDRFYKEGADPMFTAFGRAEDSNPKELAELQAQLTAIGVRFERHDEEDAALAYQNTQVGKPGSISVTPNASYSAWLHEAKHAFDDFEAGWNACLPVWNVEEHIRREINAYQEEIDYAVSLGRHDIAKQLEQLRDNEIAEIRRRDEEYARLYEIYGEG